MEELKTVSFYSSHVGDADEGIRTIQKVLENQAATLKIDVGYRKMMKVSISTRYFATVLLRFTENLVSLTLQGIEFSNTTWAQFNQSLISMKNLKKLFFGFTEDCNIKLPKDGLIDLLLGLRKRSKSKCPPIRHVEFSSTYALQEPHPRYWYLHYLISKEKLVKIFEIFSPDKFKALSWSFLSWAAFDFVEEPYKDVFWVGNEWFMPDPMKDYYESIFGKPYPLILYLKGT